MAAQPKTQFKTWDQFVADAQSDPYVLTHPDGEITIEVPTGMQVIRLARGVRDGDDEAVLAALTGYAWPKVKGLITTAPHGVVPALTETLMDHFGLYEDVTLVGPGGGSRTERIPRKIRALMNQGWTIQGE